MMPRKKGSTFTAEQKEKISEACLKRWADKPRGNLTIEHRLKLSMAQKRAWARKKAAGGVTRTHAHKAAIGAGVKRAATANRYEGKVLSAAHRKRIGDGVRAAAAARKSRERQAKLEAVGNRSDDSMPF